MHMYVMERRKNEMKERPLAFVFTSTHRFISLTTINLSTYRPTDLSFLLTLPSWEAMKSIMNTRDIAVCMSMKDAHRTRQGHNNA